MSKLPSFRFRVILQLLYLVGLVLCISAAARAAGGTPDVKHSETEPTLYYILQVLEADPNVPPAWYQLGRKLSTMPGYKAAASITPGNDPDRDLMLA